MRKGSSSFFWREREQGEKGEWKYWDNANKTEVFSYIPWEWKVTSSQQNTLKYTIIYALSTASAHTRIFDF